jgi:glycerophosphoryl diester phosphodiesterase
MNRIATWLLALGALVIFGLSFFHASWLAADPAGGPKLIASKGTTPAFDAAGCAATANLGANAIQFSPDVSALQSVAGSMADAVHVDLTDTGETLSVAPQFERKCLADTARAPSDASEVIAAVTKPELFWDVKSAAGAKVLLAKLPASDKRHIIMGSSETVKAAKSARPDVRVFDVAAARDCTANYRLSGLWGTMPESCRGGTMLLTLGDLGLTLWGWPNRLIARAAEADVTLIVAEDIEGDRIKGLSNVTQYGEIARSYNGYIWIENIAELGPALRR